MAKVLGKTQREQRFNRASRVYWGKQYDDLEPWPTPGFPLREKAPSVQVRLTKKAVDRVNSHLFGEKHAPEWKTDDDVSSDSLDEQLQAVLQASGLERRLLEVGRLGCLHGTVAIGFHRFENGRFDTETIKAGTSRPTFGRDDRARAIELNLDFDDLLELREFWRSFEEDEVTGTTREFWHRRDWTPAATLEYDPIPGPIQRPEDLNWTLDEERSQEHDLGFVPVEWITPIRVENDVDGAPIVDEPEFQLEDELNYTLSQTGRGIRYNQEPTVVFTNVDANATDAVKRGGDNTWKVAAPIDGGGSAGVELLEMNGNGAIVAMDYARMIRNLFNEIAQIVDHDPEQFSGALSGVALERLLYPMVMLVTNLRPEYEHKIGRLLAKMLEADGVSGAREGVRVTAAWPPVVSPTAQDLQQYAIAIVDLLTAGIVDQAKAIELLAPFIGVDDAEAFLEKMLERERAAGTTQTPEALAGGDEGA